MVIEGLSPHSYFQCETYNVIPCYLWDNLGWYTLECKIF